MHATLHITNGDSAGERIALAAIPGDVLVWRDILYDGTRNPGWPDEETMEARARFLEQATGGGLDSADVLSTSRHQYHKLAAAAEYERIVLWFDACLFDQSMLVHLLACLLHKDIQHVELLCVETFPGIVPFHGLGQLQPSQLASVYGQRRPVAEAQFRFAQIADTAFATQDPIRLDELARRTDAPLPWIPAAVRRWLQEQPDPGTGLGQLQRLALQAIRGGCENPNEIFAAVAAADPPPHFWGDITLWGKINALTDRKPPLVRIDGPVDRLPQWKSDLDLKRFRITSVSNKRDAGDSQ